MSNKIMNVEQLAQYLGYYLLVDYFDNLIYYIIILRLTLEVLRSTYTIAHICDDIKVMHMDFSNIFPD